MKTSNRTSFLIRRFALLVVLAAVVTAILLAVMPANATEDSSRAVPTETITVAEDQSLWTIAADISGGSGTADIVEQIKLLNSLSGSVVHPGQELKVPTR